MCAVSMVADHYNDLWKQQQWQQQWQMPTVVSPWPLASTVTREEFDELKRQVEEMKTLLMRAKDYDDRTDQPDCESAEKFELIRRIAELVGVKLPDFIGSLRDVARGT